MNTQVTKGIAFIGLSTYDTVIGYISAKFSDIRLAAFVLNFLQSDVFEVVIFKLCIVFLWLACLYLAFEMDDLLKCMDAQVLIPYV